MSKIKKIKTQTQIQTHSKSNQTARQVSERRNHTHKQTNKTDANAVHGHQTDVNAQQHIKHKCNVGYTNTNNNFFGEKKKNNKHK